MLLLLPGPGWCSRSSPRPPTWRTRTGGNCIKISLPGKSILSCYFQENRTPQRTFLLLRTSFSGRPIFIQFIPGSSWSDCLPPWPTWGTGTTWQCTAPAAAWTSPRRLCRWRCWPTSWSSRASQNDTKYKFSASLTAIECILISEMPSHCSLSKVQGRVTLVVEYLGWVDLDLGSSPGCWAATLANYCPSRMGGTSQI